MAKTEFEKPSKLLIGFALIVVISMIGLRIHQANNAKNPPTVLTIINSASFVTEVADTPDKRELGLGERDGLDKRHAMYFPFPTSKRWIFWMKGMRFPIDVVWIKDGEVVDVTKNVPVPKDGIIERFMPNVSANGVLEINAGEAAEINIKPGDKVKIRY